jgi:hypothetical protein
VIIKTEIRSTVYDLQNSTPSRAIEYKFLPALCDISEEPSNPESMSTMAAEAPLPVNVVVPCYY